MNFERLGKELGRAWMFLCTVVVTLALLGGGAYVIYNAVTSRIDPDFLEIDKCLDSGGSWDDYVKICVHTS